MASYMYSYTACNVFIDTETMSCRHVWQKQMCRTLLCTPAASQFLGRPLKRLILQYDTEVVEIFVFFFSKYVHQLVYLVYISLLLSDAVVFHVSEEPSCINV